MMTSNLSKMISLWIVLIGILPQNSYSFDCNAILTYEAPLGILKSEMKEKHFSYGLEVEYAIDEANDLLLSEYAPDTALVPRLEWESMALQDKRNYIKTHVNDLFPDGPKGRSLLVRVTPEAYFPDTLIVDETGNVELVSPKVFHDYENFDRYMAVVQKRYGDGYVQASLGVPSQAFFFSEAKKRQFVGLSFFLGEFDTLKKLADSYEKHMKIPEFIPGKSFTHPFLGPMNSPRARFMRNVVEETSEGIFTPDVLNRISKTDVSYKYTSQVVYRPDVLRSDKIFLMEVRQCVKDFDCLRRLLERQKYFMSHSISTFEKFEDVVHFDPIADFNMFSKHTQDALKRVFPRVLDRDVGDEILVAEIYRNFAYPLNHWQSWEQKLTGNSHLESSLDSVTLAQHQYVADLEATSNLLLDGKIDEKKAGSLFRVALAKFAHDSKLVEQFSRFLSKGYNTIDPKLLQ